jgi:hypothetical protein
VRRAIETNGSAGKRFRVLFITAILALASPVAIPAASPRERSQAPTLALFVSYRVTQVPRVASGLYRAAGTFTTTGRVSGSGTASFVYRITARGPDAVRGVETLRGARGRLVVRFQASIVSVGKRRINERPGPDRVVGVGVWRIASATRDYAPLRGKTGTVGYTIDFRRRTTSTLHILR